MLAMTSLPLLKMRWPSLLRIGEPASLKTREPLLLQPGEQLPWEISGLLPLFVEGDLLLLRTGMVGAGLVVKGMFSLVSLLELSIEGCVALLLLWEIDMAGLSKEIKAQTRVRRKGQRLPLYMGDDG